MPVRLVLPLAAPHIYLLCFLSSWGLEKPLGACLLYLPARVAVDGMTVMHNLEGGGNVLRSRCGSAVRWHRLWGVKTISSSSSSHLLQVCPLSLPPLLLFLLCADQSAQDCCLFASPGSLLAPPSYSPSLVVWVQWRSRLRNLQIDDKPPPRQD